MKVCLAGHGAFGIKHLEAMAKIPNIEVISLAGSNVEAAREVAQQWKIPHWTANLAESLALPELEAVLLTTPTPLHAAQGEQCMRAGKHVMIEIPMADSLADSERLGERATGNRRRRDGGAYAALQSESSMDPQNGFLPASSRFCKWTCRHISSVGRTSTRSANRAAGPIIYCGITPATRWICLPIKPARTHRRAFALQGPKHPTLGIAMDMSIGLKVPSGAICTLSLSFNNEGPLGTFFRYICDNGTYIARYDELLNGKNEAIDVSKVDVSMNGIELQDREFFAAIREHREPNASVAQVLDSYRTLDLLGQQLAR